MDAKTLRSKTVKALEQELNDARGHLKELQFRLSSNQLKNVRDVRITKKVIARIETLLKESVEKESAEKETVK